ncbi:hypothetical protein N7481_000235 [Penicillium waksmanii]|uniref:uncharacterized protein n=1 Tax=Penicillium waksmanii TaxID=69791 RepID=UPI002549AB62|nr:uncharacterized protein N7481_000235 [Penicillium waksmanii]KAJ5999826.1 hypothetical protein N7481_000235 [Penicillium waksmanii]
MMDNNSQHATQFGGNITTNDDNTITRSNLRNCAVTSSYVKRSTFDDCVLVQVRSASRSTGKKSHFHGVTSVKRSEVTESTLLEKSSAHRSTIKTSTVRDASTITTSAVTGSTISHSQLRRAKVKDCDVEDCIISRSSFEGMVLKFGVWKRGQLIGKIGDKEPVAIRKDDPRLTASSSRAAGPSSNIPAVPELDSKSKGPLPVHDLDRIDSAESAESEDSDRSEDLPPPYKV